jgi:hypothetical protein
MQTNPIVLALMFVGRCLVPVAIMLMISYLLRRWGFIQDAEPPDDNADEEEEGFPHGNS